MSKLIIKDDYSFVNDLIDDHFEYIHDNDEQEWTSAVFGDEEEVIRQLVG